MRRSSWVRAGNSSPEEFGGAVVEDGAVEAILYNLQDWGVGSEQNLKGGLGFGDQRPEGALVVEGDVGQDLAV